MKILDRYFGVKKYAALHNGFLLSMHEHLEKDDYLSVVNMGWWLVSRFNGLEKTIRNGEMFSGRDTNGYPTTCVNQINNFDFLRLMMAVAEDAMSHNDEALLWLSLTREFPVPEAVNNYPPSLLWRLVALTTIREKVLKGIADSDEIDKMEKDINMMFSETSDHYHGYQISSGYQAKTRFLWDEGECHIERHNFSRIIQFRPTDIRELINNVARYIQRNPAVYSKSFRNWFKGAS